MAWNYSATAGTPTLSVTNGSTAVTASAAVTQIVAGQAIIIAGVPYFASAVSGTSITLNRAYVGTTASGVAWTFAPTWTQSGTDTSLATLASATGSPPAGVLTVTGLGTQAGGSAGNARRLIYNLIGRIVIGGSLTMRPQNEALHIWGQPPASLVDITVNSGGSLIIDGAETIASITQYNMQTVIYSNTQRGGTANSQAFIRVLSGGTYNARGGLIESDGPVYFDASSTVIFENHIIQGTTVGNRQCVFGVAPTFNGPLTVRKMRVTIASSGLSFTGLTPEMTVQTAIDYQGSFNAPLTGVTFNDLRPFGTNGDTWLRNGAAVVIVGTTLGSAANITAFQATAQNIANGGAVTVYSRVQPSIRDASGAPIDALVFCRDTNNGARFNVSAVTPGFGTTPFGSEYNLAADRTYTWAVSGGTAIAQNVLLRGIYLANGIAGTGTIAATNGSTTVTGTGTSFTTQIAAGQQIAIGPSPATLVTVASVNSNTSLTLTSAFSGTTRTGAPWQYGSLGTDIVNDFRSVSGVAGDDRFNFDVWSYGHQTQRVQQNIAGTGTQTIPASLLTDTNVTLTQAAAAALTSIATLDDLYDAAKNWKVQSANIEYPTSTTQPVSASGTVLNLGNRNLVINGSAASAFAVNTATNTITVRSTSLAAGAKFQSLVTSGTVTFANGGAITSSYTDASGARVTIRTPENLPLSTYLIVDGVPQAWQVGQTARNIFVQPTSNVRIYAHAYGYQPRIINVTGNSAADYIINLTPETLVDTALSTTVRDTIASQLSIGVDGNSRLFLAVASDLRAYSPEEVLNALHYFIVTQGALVAASAAAANSVDAFALIQGGFVIRSPGFYGKVAESVTTVGNTGIYVPLYVDVDPSVYVAMPTYTPVEKNGSGIVLATALWTQQTAAISPTDKAVIRDGLARQASLNVINEGVKKASLLIPHTENLP